MKKFVTFELLIWAGCEVKKIKPEKLVNLYWGFGGQSRGPYFGPHMLDGSDS